MFACRAGNLTMSKAGVRCFLDGSDVIFLFCTCRWSQYSSGVTIQLWSDAKKGGNLACLLRELSIWQFKQFPIHCNSPPWHHIYIYINQLVHFLVSISGFFFEAAPLQPKFQGKYPPTPILLHRLLFSSGTNPKGISSSFLKPKYPKGPMPVPCRN